MSDKLAAIAKKLFARNRMLISFTGNNEAYGNAKPSLEKVIAGFNKISAVGNQAEVHLTQQRKHLSMHHRYSMWQKQVISSVRAMNTPEH